MGLRDGAGEVGVDDDAVEVARDEIRRVRERVAVAEQLVVGSVQVLGLALVFPAEAILLPHVREAVAPAVLLDALLEAEIFAGRILGRRGMLQQAAQVQEMLLRGGAFLQLHFPPFRDEFGNVHRGLLPNACQDSRSFREKPPGIENISVFRRGPPRLGLFADRAFYKTPRKRKFSIRRVTAPAYSRSKQPVFL